MKQRLELLAQRPGRQLGGEPDRRPGVPGQRRAAVERAQIQPAAASVAGALEQPARPVQAPVERVEERAAARAVGPRLEHPGRREALEEFREPEVGREQE